MTSILVAFQAVDVLVTLTCPNYTLAALLGLRPPS
ncbi:hypothetical protein SK36_03187 [Citrobacter sp. MGH106]|nr:hypothetical protein SK36_03187 [Citrobacter sp. MGH106]